jgi:PAS domain S-box-containing protein
VLTRNEAALIVAADGAVREVLGWDAEELVGLASTKLIHPEDQASAVGAWFDMLGEPGCARTWRGRYRAGDGTWQWVEATNTNHLDDPDDPRVVSSIVRVTVDEVTIEEELRARKQLISRLSDALPVGLFQIDADRNVTFTNDRLHSIIEATPAATADAQFASVFPEDRDRFESAVGRLARRGGRRPRSAIPHRHRRPRGANSGVSGEPQAPDRRHRNRDRRDRVPQRHHRQRATSTRAGTARQRRRADRLYESHGNVGAARHPVARARRTPGWSRDRVRRSRSLQAGQ